MTNARDLRGDHLRRLCGASPHLVAALAVCTWLVAVPTLGQNAVPRDSSKVLRLTTFATYPTSAPASGAIALDHPKDGSGRVFVSTNEGKIHLFSAAGTYLGVFLDLAAPDVVPDFDAFNFDSVQPGEWTATTRGLSYIAFHPDYGKLGQPGAGKVYTLYKTEEPGARAPDYSGASLPTRPRRDPPYTEEQPPDVLSQYAIAEWTVDGTEPNRINRSSRREVIRFEFSGINEETHSVGKISFNSFAHPGDSDYGVLYIPLGDMYSGGTLHNWQHVQDVDNPFGKVLRIDPLAVRGNGQPYSVPPDNPFADKGPLLDDDGVTEEIAALGLRHPQSLSFARDLRGDARLVVFDIGAQEYEAVRIVDIGDNHGWPRYNGVVEGVVATTLNPSPKLTLKFPVAGYPHTFPSAPGGPQADGSGAISGGFVVSDPVDPGFKNQLVFSDLPRGAFFHVDFAELVSAAADNTQAPISVMNVSLDGSAPGMFRRLIGKERGDPRFGVDERGRLFVVTRGTNTIYVSDLVAQQD